LDLEPIEEMRECCHPDVLWMAAFDQPPSHVAVCGVKATIIKVTNMARMNHLQ
jgi:hypothetical protein